MKEIIELNNRILAEAPELAGTEEGLIISRNDDPSEWAVLPETLREHLVLVLTELNRLVPDDFSYMVFLGDAEPGFSLSFEDGAQAGSFENFPCRIDESVAEGLANIDWDQQRSTGMQNCQVYDQIKEFALQTAPRIPATKALQRGCRDDMRKWVRDVRKDTNAAHVLMWREAEEFMSEEFESLDAFTLELPTLMTQQFQIIAVVAEGKPLPAPKIDQLKILALSELEEMPISHAKASGKMPRIYELMRGEDDE